MRLPRPLFLLVRSLLHGLTLVVLALVRILPERAVYGIGAGIAAIAWAATPRWRCTAERNLTLFYAGAELGADTQRARRQRLDIGRAAAINLGWFAIEFMRLGTLPLERALGMAVETEGVEELRAAIDRGRGVIMLGMHYGNWELAGGYLSQRVRQLHAVGKEQSDEFFTRLAFPWRARYGTVNIYAGSKANSAILKALRAGDLLGLVADQNGGRAGVFAPFVGIPASTVPGPAVLALRTGAPLVLVYAHRIRPGRLRFVCGPEVDASGIPGHDPATGRYTDESVAELLTRINAAYEQVIRADPTQWLWGHKRWKTRPDGDPQLY